MTEQRKLILIAGAAGAYLLLKPKKGAASPLSKLLKPKTVAGVPRAKQPTSTQIATGGGRLPALSAGQLAQLTPAQRAAYSAAQRGAPLSAAQQVAIARAQQTIPQAVIGGAFDALRAILTRQPRTPAAGPTQPGKTPAVTGGATPASGGGGAPNIPRAQDPGRPFGAYDPYSDPDNYDAYGNYVGPGAYDESGAYIGPGDPLTAGIFDPNAPTPYDFSGPIDQSSYEPGGEDFSGPIDTSSFEPGGGDFSGPLQAPVDEDGIPDPSDDFGLAFDTGDPGGAFVGPIDTGDEPVLTNFLPIGGSDDFGLGGGSFDSDSGYEGYDASAGGEFGQSFAGDITGDE